jgi:hypothetical protein
MHGGPTFPRALLALTIAGGLCGAPGPAAALMAGTLPDTPTKRSIALDEHSDWNSVGCVVVGGSPFTGVLIDRQFVLTASHVPGHQPPDHVRFVLTPGARARSFDAAAVIIFPSASFPYDDLAIVRLKKAVPGWVRIYPIYTARVSLGQRITMLGAGGSGNGDRGVTVSAREDVMRIGENVIDALVPAVDKSGRVSSFYLYDFDGPSGNGSLGGPTIGNTVETMVAPGDSGSPVFARIDGRTWLVGINTLGAPSAAGRTMDSKFGNVGGGMLLSYPPFIDWIEAVIGHKP